VHRYPDRVLLKPIQACAVYCRFCFRREQVGPDGETLDGPALDRAIAYISGKPAIWEVIVTGGDPLILSPKRLRDIMDRLTGIPHVAVIRFHSRVPIATPERLTPDHVAALRLGVDRRRAVYVGLHCNHADELDAKAEAAIAHIVDAGIPMLAQTVLLAGVNDDAAVLERLFRRLVALRVKPYYLHHLDAAPGTARFRVAVETGQALMRALRGRISGHALPEYVLDIPGGFGKVPIGPTFTSGGGQTRQVTDPWGIAHDYPPREAPGTVSTGPAGRPNR
jgi:lysine 2,3-aminomutase